MAIYRIQRLYSKPDDREDASPELIEKAKKNGVIQKVNGKWRIIAIKKKKIWDPIYTSEEHARKALAGFHASHH